MKNIRYLAKHASLALFSLLFLSTLSLSQIVLAEHGSGSGDSNESNVVTSSNSSSSSSNETENEAESNDSAATHETESHDTILAERFREQAQQQLQLLRQNVKQHTEAERRQACDARKTSLTNRMNQRVQQATKIKGVFDSFYTKVKAFHDTKQLNVTNYDSLVAAADQAQANAQSSIDALKTLDVNVDCTSQTVASSVSAFQQALKSTRDSLKSYRTALVNLVKALKAASTATSSAQNSTNSTNQ